MSILAAGVQPASQNSTEIKSYVYTDRTDIMKRFWEKVDKRDEDECWEWKAASNSSGYGRFKLNGKLAGAHRVSYKLAYEDPGDEWVLHTCDNPSCVNPNHLFLGDRSDNMKDAHSKGRLSLSGEEHPNSKLTDDDVSTIRELYNETDMTQYEIADKYEIHRAYVSSIVNNEYR